MKPNKILIIHGPNLNLLGIREPEIYGSINLDNINNDLIQIGRNANLNVICHQSNCEGDLINYTQYANKAEYCGIIINPAPKPITHRPIIVIVRESGNPNSKDGPTKNIERQRMTYPMKITPLLRIFEVNI